MPAPRLFKFNFKKYLELIERYKIPNPDKKCIICNDKVKPDKHICVKCAIKIKRGEL